MISLRFEFAVGFYRERACCLDVDLADMTLKLYIS